MQPGRIHVTALLPDAVVDRTFETPFRIGRTDDCEVCIKNEYVSRVHAEVVLNENNQWCLRDLNSSNGIFVDAQRVPQVMLSGISVVRLGIEGPAVTFTVEQPVAPPPVVEKPPVDTEKARVQQYISHYFDDSKDERMAGEHTMFVRKAFAQVQQKQRRKYGWVFVALALCILAAAGYALYEHREIAKEKASAEDLFYGMSRWMWILRIWSVWRFVRRTRQRKRK